MKLKLALVFAAAFALSACSSPSDRPATPAEREAQIAKVSAAVEGISAAASAVYLQKNPEAASYLLAGATIIEASANAGVLQPADVQAALAEKMDRSQASAVAGVLTGAFGFYQAFYGANVDAAFDTRPAYRASLLALARGVRAGAAGVPASSPPLRIPEDLILR
ncbi:MAG TPA: hypothetical protein VEC14_07345 [Reyranellaceae bacterium]|nr:hypothetical protein [Reyranellaceae bacterium]